MMYISEFLKDIENQIVTVFYGDIYKEKIYIYTKDKMLGIARRSEEKK